MKRIKQRTYLSDWFKKVKGKYRRVPYFKSIDEYDTDGHVRRKRYYWARSRINKLTLSTITLCHFDRKTNVLTCETRNCKKRLRAKEVYTYDQSNKKTKLVDILYDNREKIREKVVLECHYNSRGKRSALYFASTEYGKASCHYIYDKKGRVLREICKGVWSNECVYEYRDNRMITRYSDRIIGVTIYGKNLETYKSFSYNGVLNDMIIKKFNKFGHVISREDYSYECNCTGVYEIPRSLTNISYKYY